MDIPEWIVNPTVWLKIGGIFLLTWLALRIKKAFHTTILAHRDHGDFTLNPLSLDFFEKTLSVVIFFVSLLLILQVVGVDIYPLLTLSGIGAAGIAFASKDLIANFFGGVMIYMARSFSLTDFIELPQKNIKGSVEEIGWYFTTLRDLQKRPIYVPNSIFSTELLLNYSRITHRYIEQKIRIRSVGSDRAKEMVEEMRSLLNNHPDIDKKEPIHIFVLSISSWGFEVEVKAYTLTTAYEEFMEIKQQILLAINKIAQPLT